MNFDAGTCSLLDLKTFGGYSDKIIIDITDKTNFVILYYDENRDESIYKGHLENDQIYFDSQKIELDFDLHCCKLENGRLFAFTSSLINGARICQFVEYGLDPTSLHEISKVSCSACPNCQRRFNVSFLNVLLKNY